MSSKPNRLAKTGTDSKEESHDINTDRPRRLRDRAKRRRLLSSKAAKINQMPSPRIPGQRVREQVELDIQIITNAPTETIDLFIRYLYDEQRKRSGPKSSNTTVTFYTITLTISPNARQKIINEISSYASFRRIQIAGGLPTKVRQIYEIPVGNLSILLDKILDYSKLAGEPTIDAPRPKPTRIVTTQPKGKSKSKQTRNQNKNAKDK